MITWMPDGPEPRRDRRRARPTTVIRTRAAAVAARRPAALPALRPRDERRLVPVGRRARSTAGRHDGPPRAYVAAWRHVHAVFAAAGATNVRWVWTPEPPEHPGRGVEPTPRATTRATTSSTGSASTATTGRPRTARRSRRCSAGRSPTLGRHKPVMIAETATDGATTPRPRPRWIADARRAIDDAVPDRPTRSCGSTPARTATTGASTVAARRPRVPARSPATRCSRPGR